jgi:hypothetical protein
MRRPSTLAPAALLVLTLTIPFVPGGEAGPKDPLAAEVERWSAYLRDNKSTDEMWTQVKEGSEPVLALAREALSHDRRWVALQRLAAAWGHLAASEYMSARPADLKKDEAGFEAEWRRTGDRMRPDLGAPSPSEFAGLQPAAVRAVAEAAIPQARVYYDASLDYARSTTPDSGFFFLGMAQAQRGFVDFCTKLSSSSTLHAPPVREIRPEIDALEAELLAAYRPPASIDRHTEFIVASSTLKEARELDALGLHYGALLRYLQAALRVAPLRPSPPSLEAGAIAARLREMEARLSEGGVDSTLGRIFLESAQGDLEDTAPGKTPANAAAIASDVLPRYFAALEPARSEPPGPVPQVTVTLVRWPYT